MPAHNSSSIAICQQTTGFSMNFTLCWSKREKGIARSRPQIAGAARLNPSCPVMGTDGLHCKVRAVNSNREFIIIPEGGFE